MSGPPIGGAVARHLVVRPVGIGGERRRGGVVVQLAVDGRPQELDGDAVADVEPRPVVLERHDPADQPAGGDDVVADIDG